MAPSRKHALKQISHLCTPVQIELQQRLASPEFEDLLAKIVHFSEFMQVWGFIFFHLGKQGGGARGGGFDLLLFFSLSLFHILLPLVEKYLLYFAVLNCSGMLTGY